MLHNNLHDVLKAYNVIDVEFHMLSPTIAVNNLCNLFNCLICQNNLIIVHTTVLITTYKLNLPAEKTVYEHDRTWQSKYI